MNEWLAAALRVVERETVPMYKRIDGLSTGNIDTLIAKQLMYDDFRGAIYPLYYF